MWPLIFVVLIPFVLFPVVAFLGHRLERRMKADKERAIYEWEHLKKEGGRG